MQQRTDAPAVADRLTDERAEPPREPVTRRADVSVERSPGAAPSRWWLEVLLIGLIYTAYSWVRDATEGDPGEARRNALRLMGWQERLGIDHELGWQQWTLQHEPLVVAANVFYGSAYILGTVGVLVFLFRRHPDAYARARTALVAGTTLALVGFATFPLMPPRLLDRYGMDTGFVDTLRTHPSLWSFEADAVEALSNEFAAMPSLHCGWAFWAAAMLWPRVRERWGRALVIAYPTATVAVVVVTGNHFLLDAVGGALVMLAGATVAAALARCGTRFVPRGIQ